MKKISKIVIAFICTLSVVSCTSDPVDNRPVIEKLTAPEINSSLGLTGNVYVLKEENSSTIADKFTWTAAEFSHDVVATYTLMMDLKGGDFTNPQILATTSDVTEASITVKTLNQAAIELGAVTGTPTLFDIKIKSSLSGVLEETSQNPYTISVNAYTGLVAYPFTDWYLVGDATVSGWDNNKNNQPLFRGGNNSKIYQFKGYFKAGYFKLISILGKWAPMYGKGASGKIVARMTDADPDPDSFQIITAGYYTFTMDVENLTYTLVSYDASSSTVYPTIGYIGSSRTGTDAGWGEDTDMTQSTFDPHIWTLNISLFDGKGKFRANNAWDKNWGGDTAFSGFPTNGASGGDIPVAKSKYKIYFNDLDGSYFMLPNQE